MPDPYPPFNEANMASNLIFQGGCPSPRPGPDRHELLSTIKRALGQYPSAPTLVKSGPRAPGQEPSTAGEANGHFGPRIRIPQEGIFTLLSDVPAEPSRPALAGGVATATPQSTLRASTHLVNPFHSVGGKHIHPAGPAAAFVGDLEASTVREHILLAGQAPPPRHRLISTRVRSGSIPL